MEDTAARRGEWGGPARRFGAAIIALLLCVHAGAAQADVVIDETVAGTVFDAVIDGFPGLASFDGVPDFGNNPLAVALKEGATEERGIIEFPLHPLAGVAPGEIATATLTFNIDDVLSTFGPGTAFNGTAAETIMIFDYAGDGSVNLEDFNNAVGTPLATVDTTSAGPITDATLANSGPRVFEVDATEALRARLAAGDDFIGCVFRTEDTPTGTSLDNLGNGAAGPPGVNGSFLPFLTVVMVPGVTSTTLVTTTLLATTTTSTSTTLPDLSVCGDANDDGKITASDALLILRAAVGLGECPLVRCDTNGNGLITASDALRALRLAVGLATEVECNP